MRIIKEYSGIKIDVDEDDLNKKGVIYLLEFPNGKVYVGQTKQRLRHRLVPHCYADNKCDKVKNAIQKYKEIRVSVLEEGLTIGQLNSFEAFYIRVFNSNRVDGYNLDSGGNNKIASKETKNRMSESAKKRGISEETKRKMIESRGSRKGCKIAEDAKLKMSESHKGKKLTDEHKAAISKAMKGKKLTDEHKAAISKARNDRNAKKSMNVMQVRG